MKYYAGIDIGSTTGKSVVLDEGGKIVAHSLVPSRIDPEITAKDTLTATLAALGNGLEVGGISRIIGTGYGRIELSFAHNNVSEITCHAIGAHYLDPEIRTVIDIGGQDCKAMGLKDDGHVLDFVMNDKCAAGTGRFFEGIVRAFGIDLEEFSKLSLQSENPIPVSSQCSVFAESEVISLISQRKAPADIAAGIQQAVAKRLLALVRRVGVVEKLTVSGGCAKNLGLMKMVEKGLKIKVAPLNLDTQLVGALGAAVIAMRGE